MKARKQRYKRAKPGELCLSWGWHPHEGYDFVADHGEGVNRASANYLLNVLNDDVRTELERRGFDLSTLKFSIMKKAPGDQAPRS